MALINAVVRQAKTTGKDYILTDADGLMLFVSGKGAKKWHFRFTWMDKQQRIALGAYPEMPLKAAREQRDDLRVQVRPRHRPARSPPAIQGRRADRADADLHRRVQALARLQVAQFKPGAVQTISQNTDNRPACTKPGRILTHQLSQQHPLFAPTIPEPAP